MKNVALSSHREDGRGEDARREELRHYDFRTPNFLCIINWAGKEVEAHVASCPVLSLFRREDPVDGDSDLPYALHSY